MKWAWFAIAGLVAAQAGASVPSPQPLLDAYLKLSVVQQIPVQAETLVKDLAPGDLQQVQALVGSWSEEQIGAIRGEVSSLYGDESRNAFQGFVGEFTTAEQQHNAAYLQALCTQLALPQPWPTDYLGLRRTYIETRLVSTIAGGSDLLGEVQTWADLRRRAVPGAPDLATWITRSEPTPAGSPAAPAPRPTGNPLRDAEAGFDAQMVIEEDDFNPLDSFNEMRNQKRAKMLEEAQAGMQQVAAERKAAEEEYAAKKMAAAQKESEAMKRHAEQLASVEQQALEQRQRSWGNRLKRIVGATISATGSAFLGDIGARAGTEAANALFNP